MTVHRESDDVIRSANDLIRRGLIGAASDLLVEGVEDHPDDAHLLRALAKLRMLERRPAEAVPLLKRALEILQGNQSQGTATETVEFPQENSEGSGGQNTAPPPPLTTALSSATFAQLPDSNLEYASAVENEIIGNRDYEFRYEEHLKNKRDLGSAEFGAIPTRIEDEPLNRSTSNPNDSPVDPTDQATVPPRVFRAQPFPIDKVMTFEAHAQVLEGEDEDSLTIEDLYVDEEAVEEHQASSEPPQEIPNDDVGFPNAILEESLAIDIEQRDYEPALDDFGDGPADELPTREEMRRIPSHLTREERARQVAFALAFEFGWDRAGIELLTSLFVKHWWGAARVALQREMQAGATPKDISLSDALREIWRSYPEFSYHVDYRGQVSQRYTVLPWPTAIALVRAFQGYPDEAELESFLVDAYETWWNDGDVKERFDSLYNFLRYRMSQFHKSSGLSPWDIFRYELIDLDARGHLHRIQKLEAIGVPVPDWESDHLPVVDLRRSAAVKKGQDSIAEMIANLQTMEDGEDVDVDEEEDS